MRCEHSSVVSLDGKLRDTTSIMALDESETLPLLQQDTESRTGRRATRRVVAAAATLVTLSALAYSSTAPRAAAARREPPRGASGAFSWTCPECGETCLPGSGDCAPLAGTSGDYGETCKGCSAGTTAGSDWWSCNCQMPNGYFRGTSTVWKSSCEGTWLVNNDGCLQCKSAGEFNLLLNWCL